MSKKAVEQEEVVGGEIALSLAEEISSKVQLIRQAKAMIEEKKEVSGIVDLEANVEDFRADLLELVRQYNELTGTNFQDAEGFARYVHPGQSHKYPTPTVDEVAAGIAALEAEADGFAVDVPIRYVLDMEGEKVIASFDDLKEVKAFGKTEVMVALVQEREERVKMAQEISLRLQAIDVLLKKLAGSRKTTELAEGVSVR